MINQEGLDLIKYYEAGGSFSKKGNKAFLTAYLCPAGVPTIGYGHTRTVTESMVDESRTITITEAERLLIQDVSEFEDAIDSLVKAPISHNQRAALVSFAFNVGKTAFSKSTMLKKLNARDYAGAAAEFSKWNKGGGRVLPGLVKRRAAEMALFLKDVGMDDHAPLPQVVQATAIRPSGESDAVKAAGASAGMAGAMMAASQIREVADAAKGLTDMFPTAPWPVLVGVLLAAIAFMVWRRNSDSDEYGA